MAESSTQVEWRRWIADHAPKLLLFARQKARSEADAQDLMQEAVVECWQRIGDGPPERTDPVTQDEICNAALKPIAQYG